MVEYFPTSLPILSTKNPVARLKSERDLIICYKGFLFKRYTADYTKQMSISFYMLFEVRYYLLTLSIN